MLDEARHGLRRARLMTVGVHAAWSGQPGRAAAGPGLHRVRAWGQEGRALSLPCPYRRPRSFWNQGPSRPLRGLEVVPGAGQPRSTPPSPARNRLDVSSAAIVHAGREGRCSVTAGNCAGRPEQVWAGSKNGYVVLNPRAWAGSCHQGVDPGRKSSGLTPQVLVESRLVHDGAGGGPRFTRIAAGFHQAQFPARDQPPGLLWSAAGLMTSTFRGR